MTLGSAQTFHVCSASQSMPLYQSSAAFDRSISLVAANPWGGFFRKFLFRSFTPASMRSSRVSTTMSTIFILTR